MVKASFSQHWRGSYYPKGEPIPASEEQAERLVRCGQAYVEADTPTTANTKAEIMAYLEADGINFDPSLTKAQLLELC